MTGDLALPASSSSDIAVDLDTDYVATVEICRAPNNFLDTELVRQLAETFDFLAATTKCRSIVLCSQGRHFCAGLNFGQPQSAHDRSGPHLYEVALRLFQQPLPVVAAIQGGAIGGGLGLALVADFRVASPEARFSANFARLGFHHGFAMSVTLPAVVGQQSALDLLYSGRRIGGEEARRLGLCDRLVDSDDLRASAHSLAREVALSAPLAVRSIRQTMRGSLVVQAKTAMDRERAEQERLVRTRDWREGVSAMNERRVANFTGE